MRQDCGFFLLSWRFLPRIHPADSNPDPPDPPYNKASLYDADSTSIHTCIYGSVTN